MKTHGAQPFLSCEFGLRVMHKNSCPSPWALHLEGASLLQREAFVPGARPSRCLLAALAAEAASALQGVVPLPLAAAARLVDQLGANLLPGCWHPTRSHALGMDLAALVVASSSSPRHATGPSCHTDTGRPWGPTFLTIVKTKHRNKADIQKKESMLKEPVHTPAAATPGRRGGV